MNNNITTLKSTAPKKTLGEVLIESDLIFVEQLEAALDLQQRDGKSLGDVLVEQSIITPNELAMALSIQLHMPLIDLKRHVPTPRALKMIPVETARKHNLIPLDIVKDVLIVVMADPTNIRIVEDLQAQSKMRVEPALGIPSAITDAINIHYRSSAEIEKRVREFAPTSSDEDKAETDLFEQTAVTETLDLLIAQAVRDRASDIHIEPQKNELRIRYRIDGVLHDVDTLPLNAKSPLISSIKILAGMNIAEQMKPQDGQFSTLVGKRNIDIRAATAETIYGERATLRILDKSLSLMELDQLGFLKDDLNKYKEMLASSFGMALICGPTGSGKTTTLYASINQLDRIRRNIMTVEDPVEYRLNGINQIQINVKAGRTFATGLRSLMRHDPDVIMIGEIRDSETADIGCQAALTGHLVMSSVHANDAVGALFRLMDLGVEPYVISASLVGIIAQRMVRRVCSHCCSEYLPESEETMAYEKEMGSDSAIFIHGTGCNFCNMTGFLGRVGIFEILSMSENLREMVINQASAGEIRAAAYAEGLVTMRHDGMAKVQQQITTPSEVLRGLFSIGQQ